MFAADADLQVGTRLAAALHAECDKLSDAAPVQHLEGIVLQYLALNVLGDEHADVIATEPVGHLRQVVRAEAEEVGVAGDLIGGEGGARHLDHRADPVLHLRIGVGEHVAADLLGGLPAEAQFLVGAPAFVAETLRGHPPLGEVPGQLDVGLFYVCLAGLLNGLVLIDVFAWGESRALGADPVEDRRAMAAHRRDAKKRGRSSEDGARGAKAGASPASKHLVTAAPVAADDADAGDGTGDAEADEEQR